ncbi:MAG: hydrolase [Fibrobacteres bacterium]|nr:hydrolase [Fibrobacterota bacterium]
MDRSSVTDEPERLRQAPKYRAWKQAVEKSGCTVRKVELLAEMDKQDGSLLFAMLRTRVEDPQGRPLPAYALIRGHAVVIVTIVINEETLDRKFLMVRQRRIGNGSESLEFPAGMLDEDVADPKGVAIRELKEETGLDATRDQLFSLSERPLYSSSGLDDEAIHYFCCELVLPPERFHALEGGETGKADEHEYIRLGLWDYERALPEVDSIQVRLGFCLYFEHQRRQAAA